MRHLITGVTGFAGGHLAEALLASGSGEVFGVARHSTWPPQGTHLKEQIPLSLVDLSDAVALTRVLSDVRPDRIYHLAGYASAGRSFHEPDAAWSGNLGATRTLYDAVVRWGGRPRLLFVGSGLVYGDPETPEQAFDEGCLLRPTSPYAASKAAADLLSYQYSQAPGLEIIRARPFNHIGPRQSPDFAVAQFARQIAAIAQGLQSPVLETGNLTPRRDLTDVRDVVLAYILLSERGVPGEAYNVGSGQPVAMREIVERLAALAGVCIELRTRDDLLRPTDAATVRADVGKLRRTTGWRPRWSLDETLRETLAYWMRHQEASL